MFLIKLALFVASASATAPYGANDSIAYTEGVAKHYEPGLFAQVLRVRQRQGLIPYGVKYDGLASSVNCADIGEYRYVSVRNPYTRAWSPLRRVLIADCSRPGADRARHIRQNLVIELDYKTAEWAGFAWDGRRGEGKARARVWGAE